MSLQRIDEHFAVLQFNTAEKAQEEQVGKQVESKFLQLVSFKQFKTTAGAVEAAPQITEGKLSLKKLIKSSVDETGKLAVGDAKLGNLIEGKLPLNCVHDISINELMSGVRAHIDELMRKQMS
ncbi:unnamed protein product [Caenorhabditis sp. 36 PRJEB53466]|nr:unnamed protein product [Caenorhabditis sp. 36 PRJEB53466]